MNFFGKILAASFFFVLAFSCSQYDQPDFDKSNADFSKKYGKQVDNIRTVRTPQDDNSSKQVIFSTAPTTEQVAIDTANEYYPYADIAKFGEKLPMNYLPNAESYSQAKNKSPAAVAPNIFDITYNTTLYPPFRRIGAEFDRINIPQYDAYGVKTAMSDKTYLLPGGRAMQQAIDMVENSKAPYDDEISAILVSEKKQIARKKKSAKMLGEEDNIELAEIEEKTKTEEKKSEDESAEKPNKEKIQQASNNANSGFSIRTIKN